MVKPVIDIEKSPAADVLAAFHVARKAGLPVTECYRAGVAAWLRHHPRQRRPYAAERAVAIILAHRWSVLLRQYRNEWDRSTGSKDEARQNAREVRPSASQRPLI
jgi:hypothetical protein